MRAVRDFFNRDLRGKMFFLREQAFAHGHGKVWKQIIDPWWKIQNTERMTCASVVQQCDAPRAAPVVESTSSGSADPAPTPVTPVKKSVADLIQPLDPEKDPVQHSNYSKDIANWQDTWSNRLRVIAGLAPTILSAMKGSLKCI